jgi:hypothetical protein
MSNNESLSAILRSDVPTDVTAPEQLNPFTPENLRLDQAFNETLAVKKLLTVVPVRRPGAQDWIRVHPSPDYRQPVAVIDLRDDRETFVVTGRVASELVSEIISVTLHVCVNRQNVCFLWPIRLPDASGKDSAWWSSARDAADRATKSWIRVKADMSLGAYAVWEAADNLGEPTWPDLDFWQLVQIAFKNALIDSVDHPVVRRLRGYA